MVKMDLDKIYFLLESKENNNKEIFKVYTKLVSKLGINNAVFFTQILDSLYQLIEDEAIKENESFYINLKDIHDYTTQTMNDTIEQNFNHSNEELEMKALQALGSVCPVSNIQPMVLPMFDNARLVAGFPLALDTDEQAQDVDILRMLCPNPEASFLIRVKGNSMIDAKIYDGDIIIVDKSNRSPSNHEVAVCELNGEYTIKHVLQKDSRVWLYPANPDYQPIEVKECDDFSVWGVVTYTIHKPRV